MVSSLSEFYLFIAWIFLMKEKPIKKYNNWFTKNKSRFFESQHLIFFWVKIIQTRKNSYKIKTTIFCFFIPFGCRYKFMIKKTLFLKNLNSMLIYFYCLEVLSWRLKIKGSSFIWILNQIFCFKPFKNFLFAFNTLQ